MKSILVGLDSGHVNVDLLNHVSLLLLQHFQRVWTGRAIHLLVTPRCRVWCPTRPPPTSIWRPHLPTQPHTPRYTAPMTSPSRSRADHPCTLAISSKSLSRQPASQSLYIAISSSASKMGFKVSFNLCGWPSVFFLWRHIQQLNWIRLIVLCILDMCLNAKFIPPL